MKLLFKQRFFTWFDSYDIYDEAGQTLFTVEGQLAWGHTLHINDASGVHIATVKQQVRPVRGRGAGGYHHQGFHPVPSRL